ncbi:MAG: hypothetical protein AAGF12_40060 [Myxococcota bacterium]
MRTFLGLFLVSSFAFALGCGGGRGRANVTAGSMPSGGSFTGVWFSPQYGEMHMLQQGASVIGEYRKDERAGRIQGTAQGNLMRFEWTEERQLVSGRPTLTRGRGYFQYAIGDDDRHNILGEWGIDDDEVGGGEWNAYRLRNRRPELSGGSSGSEEGDGLESFDDDGSSGGDDFDSGGGDDFDSGGGDDFDSGGDGGDPLDDLDL